MSSKSTSNIQPPLKKRRLNSSQSKTSKQIDSIQINESDKIEESQPIPSGRRVRKRKLPSFMTRSIGDFSRKSPRRNSRRNVSTTSTTGTNTNHNICESKPVIEPFESIRSDHDRTSERTSDRTSNRTSFQWSDIAVTSLSTILEFVNIKFLYFSASKVCRNWHNTICGKESDFVFGYFRKTLSMDPTQPLSLSQLQSFTLQYIKQELKERNLSVKAKKAILVQRLYESIQTDGLPRNIQNRESVQNRKRLIVFRMQQLFRNELFCQNCHRNWTSNWESKRARFCKMSFVRKLTEIHFGIRACINCRGLKQYQDIGEDEARKYYGLNREDVVRCGVQWRVGAGLSNTAIQEQFGEYINGHVALEIAKMKYGAAFQRRTIRDSFKRVPNKEFSVDLGRFECDEILFNSTLKRACR